MPHWLNHAADALASVLTNGASPDPSAPHPDVHSHAAPAANSSNAHSGSPEGAPSEAPADPVDSVATEDPPSIATKGDALVAAAQRAAWAVGRLDTAVDRRVLGHSVKIVSLPTPGDDGSSVAAVDFALPSLRLNCAADPMAGFKWFVDVVGAGGGDIRVGGKPHALRTVPRFCCDSWGSSCAGEGTQASSLLSRQRHLLHAWL